MRTPRKSRYRGEENSEAILLLAYYCVLARSRRDVECRQVTGGRLFATGAPRSPQQATLEAEAEPEPEVEARRHMIKDLATGDLWPRRGTPDPSLSPVYSAPSIAHLISARFYLRRHSHSHSHECSADGQRQPALRSSLLLLLLL